MEARMARPRSIVGPAVLIVLGALFLGNNLGLLDQSVWQLVGQFWPLVLVALGLDILVRRSTPGGFGTAISLLALVLVILSVAAAVAITSPHFTLGEQGMVVTTNRVSGPVVRLGGPVHSQAIGQSLDGAERAVVELSLGVGEVTVGTMQEASGLVEGSLALGEDERVAQEYHVSGGTGYFRLKGNSPSVVRGGASTGEDRNWDLRLNPDIPTDLKVNTGVGSARMDLAGMRLTSLRIDSGVGNNEVKLPSKAQYQVTINGGVGRTTIQVPRGMPARIEVDRGLASVDIDGEFRRNGNSYTSRDYQPGQNSLEMTIHGGIGKIMVTEY